MKGINKLCIVYLTMITPYLHTSKAAREDDNLPIKVTWTSEQPNLSSVVKIQPGDLYGSTVDEMFRHYKALHNNEVKGSVQDGFLLRGSPELMSNANYRKNEVLKKFIHHTIDAVATNYNNSDCGVSVMNGTISLRFCPGLLTVITTDHIGVYSCAAIQSLSLYGPVIIKSEKCSEQIISRGDCNLAFSHGFIDSDCHKVSVNPEANKFLIAFSILISLNICLLIGSLIFIVRYKRVKKDFNSTVGISGIELYNFSSFDSERGRIVTKENLGSEEEPCIHKKKFSWFKILLLVLSCRPIKVSSYELLETQNIADNLFKYTVTMGSSEVIHTGTQHIRLDNSDTESRIVHMFTTYDWEARFDNKYHCLQSGCNNKLICREDLLPFTKAGNLIDDEFPEFKDQINYYTCKNLRVYCLFGSGCFIMTFSLFLGDHRRYEVYSVGQQHRISTNVLLPTGCYLDEFIPSRSAGVDEMYYIEDSIGNSWFCHPTIYTHYPLPHSLGDLKVGNNNTINFISDFFKCAFDYWRGIYCVKPTSFMSHIDDYCVKNSPETMGFTVSRGPDSLIWPSDKMEKIKFSCDRDLQLIQSEHHCKNIIIEVWDTGNMQSDLMMSVFANSDSGIGVFVLNETVHAESHHFGCNGVWHNTFLYDLHSLNSSGLTYRFHTNVKQLINDDTIGTEVIPKGEDHWYNHGLGNWFSSVKEWLTGFSSISSILIIIVVVIFIKH